MRAKNALPVFSLLCLLVAACDMNNDTNMFGSSEFVGLNGVVKSSGAPGAETPADLVTVSYGGGNLELWPYLTPDGITREDPVNLLFAGKTSAMQIRAALLALDGNRTAFGFPPVYPFNATWSDAIGGVQAGYADGAGWTGSVIQLQLGNYGPIRFHLRLFDTGLPFGNEGTWTIGGAHFEILIPGTPEHQVVSWELAEKMVTADLARAGILLAAPSASSLINDAPGFRTIPPVIYNGIPDALKVACGLPTGSSATPVAIPTDGRATLLRVRETALDSGNGAEQSLTVQFHQVIPKPFCAAGPSDYYVVDGPVLLTKTVRIDGNGGYSYHSELSGQLTATPYGGGGSFDVRVHDTQSGFVHGENTSVNASVKRIAPQDAGTELLMQRLNVGTQGADFFSKNQHCLTP